MIEGANMTDEAPTPADTLRELDQAKRVLRSAPGEAELFVVGTMIPDPRLPSTLQDRQRELYRASAAQFGLGKMPARRA